MEQSTFRCIVLTRKNAIMYTLEEINQAASAKAWKIFWVWLLVFGIPVGFLNYKAISYGDPPLFMLDLFLIFGAGIMSWVAYANERKKLNNENAEEERQQREEHYRKMEELLEKMSKDKETT